MELTRRDFLKASSALAAAFGLQNTDAVGLKRALAAEGALPVIWLQGAGCNGCSVSLLNTIYYTTIDQLLTKTIDLEYHPTVMAAAGAMAVKAATDARARGKYVLVVEGSVPTGANGRYCTVWPGMTVLNAVRTFASNTPYVIAVGTCATGGGIPAGRPNPTGVRSVQAVLGSSKRVINIPGCPANPDWIVGTVAYMIQNNRVPALDSQGRPTQFFGQTVHANCPRRDFFNAGQFAAKLGDPQCLRNLGCRGPQTYADCASRGWNSPAANTRGVNWCVAAGAPCHGCTENVFPDGVSPFYAMAAPVLQPGAQPPSPTHAGGQPCTNCHTYTSGGGGGGGTGAPPIAPGTSRPSGHYSGTCTNCHTYTSGGGSGGGTTPPSPGHGGGQPCATCHGSSSGEEESDD